MPVVHHSVRIAATCIIVSLILTNQYEAVLVIYTCRLHLGSVSWFLRYSLDIVLLGLLLIFNVVLYWGVSYWAVHETHAKSALMKASVMDPIGIPFQGNQFVQRQRQARLFTD